MTDETTDRMSKVAARTRDAVCSLWWWLLLRGVALIVLAVCALFWPQKTVGLMVKILGVYLILDGLWNSVTYAFSKEKDQSLLVGAVGLLVGAILLFWTDVSGRVFMTIIGIWSVLQGLGIYFKVRKESDADAEAKTLMKCLALMLAITGVILIVWPSSGIAVIGWLISAVALVLGGGMVFVAMKLRTLGKRIGHRSVETEASA